jgi:EAL domain-containing protein (putative c-di-GMP-specific phosphodiesterase class I)
MAFSMAFQPIVDVVAHRVYAYEALVRGPSGEPASTVLSQLNQDNLYIFDQSCRVQAIALASHLGLLETGACLSINFLPGAVYTPAACISVTLKTAQALNFPTDRLIFEVSESEQVKHPLHLQNIADEYSRQGFRIAIDDFGSGFANMSLLADLAVDVLKLDMQLIRNIHLRPKAQAIICSMVTLSKLLKIDIVAEGVETAEEYASLRGCGIRLMQGYLLAQPAFEALPPFSVPDVKPIRLSRTYPSATQRLYGTSPS